ncbi:hypothetical protein FB451DRAFT_160259 [Mycena latifolia]|nr:hypothetical protein FB451DRAFT_160259 [Mycena latifolia]
MEEEDELVNDTLFVRGGKPLKFYLHSSIKQLGARSALEAKIELYGGAVNAERSGSNIILVNPKDPTGDLEALRHMYKTHSDPSLKGVHVETMRWVDNSVKMGKCVHLFTQKRMGGVAPGGFRERTEFSAEDDRKLCRYVGTLIPDKTNGGRTGNNIYIRLMENAKLDPKEYGWVLRHTWQSWRERYKKNQERFDRVIEEQIVPLGVAPHQMYNLSRKAPRRSGGNRAMEEEEEESENENEDENENENENEDEDEDYAPAPSRKRRVSVSGSGQRDAKKQRRDLSPDPFPEFDEDPGDVFEDPTDIAEDRMDSAPRKGTTPPCDDDDGVDNSLFDGPTQHTSSPAEVLPSPRMRSSQATLVGTAPRRETTTSAGPLVQRNITEPPAIEEHPPRRAQPARVTRPAARPVVPRTAKRKASPVPEVQAPRTRSRTAEPAAYVEDINALMRKNRKKGKNKDLEPVDEESDTHSRGPEGTVETQEEQNVEDILLAANDQSGISEGGTTLEEVESMPPPREVRPRVVRRPSLETDDGQTDLALRHRRVSFSSVAHSSVASTYAGERAKEILRQLGGPRLSRPSESVTSKAASSLRYAQNSPPDGFSGIARRSSHVPSIDPQNPFYTQSAGPPSVSRKDSVSSDESFPTPNTGARTYKREAKEKEKHMPYRPPPGTRAAALTQ